MVGTNPIWPNVLVKRGKDTSYEATGKRSQRTWSERQSSASQEERLQNIKSANTLMLEFLQVQSVKHKFLSLHHPVCAILLCSDTVPPLTLKLEVKCHSTLFVSLFFLQETLSRFNQNFVLIGMGEVASFDTMFLVAH